jgi:outer membrane autotransporter protein
LSGTFDFWFIFASVYTDGALSYSPNGVDIALTRASATSVAARAAPATATNIQQSAEHVEKALQQADTWSASGDPRHVSFLAAATALERTPTLAAAAASLDSLSGQIHASSQALTLQQAGIVTRTLVDRLAGEIPSSGAWAQGTGSNGDVGRSGFATGKFSGGGAMAGADATIADGVVAGAALDWNKLNATYEDRTGKSDTRTSGISLYAQANAEHAYAMGRVGEDWIRSRVSRWALLGTVQMPVDSTRNDRLTSLYFESGYRLGAASDRFVPFAAASVNRLRRDDIRENGAGGFGLSAEAATITQTSGQLGARWAHAFGGADRRSSFSAYALWQHVFSGRNTSFDAAFTGAPGVGFRVDGAHTPRDTAWIGAGLTTRIGEEWSWYANADVQFAGGATRSRSVSAGLRLDM